MYNPVTFEEHPEIAEIIEGLRRVIQPINIDLATADLDPTGKTDASQQIQTAIDRALRDYPVVGTNPYSKTYITIKVILPLGRFLIDKTLVIDCNLVNNGNSSDIITSHITGGGGGVSGTALILGKNNPKLMEFKHGTFLLEQVRFFGHSTGTGITVGTSERDPNASNLGDQVMKQSIIRECEWHYFNKVWEVKHAFDIAFYNCGFMACTGTKPIAFEIVKHADDPSNNIIFNRCHWEQLPDGTMFKVTGGAGHIQQNNFAFFGCHFETRNWNTVIFEAEHSHRISFYNTQFTQNNTQGRDRGVTEKDIVPMFKIKNSSSIHYYNCTMSRIGVSNTAAVGAKLFELGGYTNDIRIVGGIIEPGTFTNMSNLWQPSVDTPPVSLGEAPLNLDGVLPGPRLAAITNDRSTLTSPKHSNRKWGTLHEPETNELHFGYTQHTEKNFEYAAPAARLTTDGMLQAKGFAGVKLTAANDSVVKYAISAANNNNKRGFFTVSADAPGQPFVLCFSMGSQYVPIFVGTSAQVEQSDVSAAGKMIVFPDANGNIAIRNMLGSTRNFTVTFIG